MRRIPLQPPRRQAQRGVVAIVVGLSLAVLIGFVGLALDGGRLYLTKTELQNAADSCALAASYELTGAPSISAAAFTSAEAAGIKLATSNRVGFQGADITGGMVTVTFSNSLAGGAWSPADAAAGNSKYVRCTIQRNGIMPWFMQVLGIGAQTVSSFATATLAPSQSNCAVPMALCVLPGGTAPDFGYVVGNWYGMDFSQNGGGPTNYTGNFRWVDFDPSAPTPGCSGGGANELACLLAGTGQCSLPAPITGSCSSSGSSNPTPGCIGQTGAINSLQDAYNSRFGVYKNSGDIAASPPDRAGYAYSTENWTLGSNAYGGSVAGLNNFKAARNAHQPAANVAGVNPAFFGNAYSPSTQAQHQSYGTDRRLVTIPIVDCGSFTGSQHAPIRGYACVLMLDPYRRQGNDVKSRLEYLGRSNAAGSPCATSGIAGDATSQGPMVPALVQ